MPPSAAAAPACLQVSHRLPESKSREYLQVLTGLIEEREPMEEAMARGLLHSVLLVSHTYHTYLSHGACFTQSSW